LDRSDLNRSDLNRSELDRTELNPGEEKPESSRALYRSALGLGLVAIGWTLAIVLGRQEDDSPVVWVIPIAAALFGGALFVQARRPGDRQE